MELTKIHPNSKIDVHEGINVYYSIREVPNEKNKNHEYVVGIDYDSFML